MNRARVVEHALSPVRRLYRQHRVRHERRYRREAEAGRTLTMAEIDAVLDELGIGAGDRVSVHSHTAVIGHVEGGVNRVIERLKERVTPAGMLLMVTLPCAGSLWEYAKTDPVFDVRRTPSQMGLMTELFRRSRGATRSLHPTHPVALWGNEAQAWAVGHENDPVPFHLDSPYGRLYRHRGKILFMELDGWHLTEIHTVEGILKSDFPSRAYLPGPVDMKVVDFQRKERKVPVFLHAPGPVAGVDARHFFPELERRGVVKRRWLRGYIPFVVIDAAPMVDYLVENARRGKDYFRVTSASGRLRRLLVGLGSDAPPAVRLPAGRR